MSYREDQQYIFGCLLLLSNKLQLLGDKITGALTLKQWFLLNMIHNMKQKSPNIIEIARVIGTSRQNVSKMIAILEKKGMVKLDSSEMDHRAVNVTLTQKCFDYFASNESAGSQLLDTFI
jgi:DNA-binding MarR family transcriptional regulator